jgi:hypothetical protein
MKKFKRWSTMQCNEVIRELAVPTDDRDSAALAEHLASCPSCARWAKRDAQFDRLWITTRPVEPSPQVWDGVWVHVASSLDSSPPAKFEALAPHVATLNGSIPRVETPFGLPRVSSPRSRPWNWAAVGLIGLAQAAAVLLAVGLTWRTSTKSQEIPIAISTHSVAMSPEVSAVAKESGLRSAPVVEIEAGQMVLIRVEDSVAKVVDLTPDRISYSVDDWYLVFNAVEAIANPVIAMKE